MDVKIRRLENNLITLGAGIIAFGMWSFIKNLLTNLTMGESITGTVGTQHQTAFNLIGVGVILISFLTHLWIGLSARAEGKGKRTRIFYLIAVIIIILCSVLIILTEILLMIWIIEINLSTAITIIVDITKTIFMIELLYSSVTLRKLKKKRTENQKAVSQIQGGNEA